MKGPHLRKHVEILIACQTVGAEQERDAGVAEKAMVKGWSLEKGMRARAMDHRMTEGILAENLPVALIKLVHVDEQCPLLEQALPDDRADGRCPAAILHRPTDRTKEVVQLSLPAPEHGHLLR